MKKLLCLLLFAGSLTLLFAAKGPEQVQIKGVRGKMLDNIQMRLLEYAKSKPLLSDTNENLEKQVAQAVYAYGYLRPSIQVSRTGGGKTILINVNPGPPLLVTRLAIQLQGEGADNAKIKRKRHHLPIQQGKPLNSIKYEESKQLLIDAAEQEGYLHAHFQKAEILIDQTSYTSVITLVFDTGPQFYFGHVRFEPTYISPELLRRYIPFDYGQPYSTEQLLELSNSLAGSGYFSQVNAKPDMNGSRSIPVNVYLKAAARINYSLGLGFGTDTGIRGRVGYHVVPVNRAGHKFNAIALGSFNQNTLQAQYVIPGKNPLTDEYDITGNLSNLDYGAGYSNSLLLSMGQRHNKDQFQRMLTVNGLYERFNYDNAPKLEKLTFFPKATLGWKNTSNQLFSPTGYHITFNALGASRAVLSEVSFAQASVDARAAITLPFIRTRFYFHTLQGITDINDVNQLPLSLALLLGGSDNLKAFTFNAIGPGKILTYGGFEIQKETVEHWYLTGFFDSGDVYDPSPRVLQNDLGIGLMWVSPVGPIKIGIAQAVDSHFNRIKDRKPRFVVNMGPDL
ncbi:BamA/TamA family outer membrane protein [Legionella sp. MW5194]|uniref:autotransporter assembly complex protein TamA n=1 Tax=Legionella sp. MW5194 TaxID=2662448 RepID=UPI00193E9B4C|nr:POTRA domain-containing protein [Legionella sp. MW5194]QRN04346.1 BamA/TamA family outer membrane protein [Legionella sp. MW5194]